MRDFLINTEMPIINLSFEEIERIIGTDLPNSARIHADAWWSNNYDHSKAIAWMDAGYRTECVSDTYADEKIIFEKG